jgi:hypothetical protein
MQRFSRDKRAEFASRKLNPHEKKEDLKEEK